MGPLGDRPSHDRALPSAPPRPGHVDDFSAAQVDSIRVICTSDERDQTLIRDEILPVVPCVYANHTLLGTVERYGVWFPTVLDAIILSRGIGFVGTEGSTVSSLASLRVKWWQRGATTWAYRSDDDEA